MRLPEEHPFLFPILAAIIVTIASEPIKLLFRGEPVIQPIINNIMPEIKMPEVKVPEVKIPEIKIPPIKLIEINFPDFKQAEKK